MTFNLQWGHFKELMTNAASGSELYNNARYQLFTYGALQQDVINVQTGMNTYVLVNTQTHMYCDVDIYIKCCKQNLA